MEFLLCGKKRFWRCFICAFFKVFVCLSSFASLLNGKLEFSKILLTFASAFISSGVLSFAEFVLIFGTESRLVVSELDQTSF